MDRDCRSVDGTDDDRSAAGLVYIDWLGGRVPGTCRGLGLCLAAFQVLVGG